jgi:hypothetical protein
MHNITKGPGQQVGNKENEMPQNGKCNATTWQHNGQTHEKCVAAILETKIWKLECKWESFHRHTPE